MAGSQQSPRGAGAAAFLLGLQRAAGNRAVAGVVADEREDLAATSSVALDQVGKQVGNQEELAKRVDNEEELAKGGAEAPGSGLEPATRVVGHERSPGQNVLPAGMESLCKAWFLSANSGAAASNALGAGDYGLTFPENVTVGFTAEKNTVANTWSPNVWTVTGNYSKQVRLLPGQTEITGPTGNTDVTNYASQARALKNLGNTADPWYKIEAVRRHENVHATRFKPALRDSNAAISAAVEGVTVPHVAGMTASTAKAQLKASGGMAVALAGAQATWLANILVRVAGDHAAGGPTDTAEKWVTEPSRLVISAYRRLRGWPATPDC